MSQSSPREQWSSMLVFVLATTGAAVGLGNIWKFPYMVGTNGGSAFVILYLVCVALIAMPVMIAELIMGKRARANPVNSLAKLAKEAKTSSHWIGLGWMGAFTLLLAFSFYSVIASWGIAYMIYAASGTFVHASSQHINQVWGHFISNPKTMLFWDTLFIVITMLIVVRGVSKGLEKASIIMMPGLLILLVFLAGYGLANGDAVRTWHYLFDFKISAITPAIVVSAMGHAFFSLAVGACCILVYGSYLPKKSKWSGTLFYIVIIDVLVALLSGLAIFPLVFAYHLSLTSGPGLMFEALPNAFASMEYGRIIAFLFFVLLAFAALSSSISFAEPLVILFTERYRFSRLKGSLIVGSFCWILSIGSVLSFNVWHNDKLFGQWNFFAVVTDLTTNFLLPIGGLLIAIFAGWIMLKKSTQEEFEQESNWLYVTWRFLVRYITPIGIVVILVSPLLVYL